MSALRRGPSGPTGPEALGSASGCPVASSLTTASSAPLGPSRRLIFFIRRVFASWAGGREGPCFRLRILPPVPPSVPRQAGRPETIRRPPVIAFARMRGARRLRLSHLNRYTWAALTRLRSSLDAAARTVACPSPTRTFTFELSSHESPQWDVEYDYAGKSSISRGRTCTGWIRSLTGCTALRAAVGSGAEVVGADGAEACMAPPPVV